jgi:hypothetical protein
MSGHRVKAIRFRQGQATCSCGWTVEDATLEPAELAERYRRHRPGAAVNATHHRREVTT